MREEQKDYMPKIYSSLEYNGILLKLAPYNNCWLLRLQRVSPSTSLDKMYI
jgi:hypothetical protein